MAGGIKFDPELFNQNAGSPKASPARRTAPTKKALRKPARDKKKTYQSSQWPNQQKPVDDFFSELKSNLSDQGKTRSNNKKPKVKLPFKLPNASKFKAFCGGVAKTGVVLTVSVVATLFVSKVAWPAVHDAGSDLMSSVSRSYTPADEFRASVRAPVEITDEMRAERFETIVNEYADEAMYHLLQAEERPDFVDEDSWRILQAMKLMTEKDFREENIQRDLRYVAAAVLVAPFYNSENPAFEVMRYVKKSGIESSFFMTSDLDSRFSSACAPTQFTTGTAQSVVNRADNMPQYIRTRFEDTYNSRAYVDREECLATDFRMDFFGSPMMQYEFYDQEIDRVVGQAYRDFNNLYDGPVKSAVAKFFTQEYRYVHEYAAHQLGGGGYANLIEILLTTPYNSNNTHRIWGSAYSTFLAAGGNPGFYNDNNSGLDLNRYYINAKLGQTAMFRGAGIETNFARFSSYIPSWREQVSWRTPMRVMESFSNEAGLRNDNLSVYLRAYDRGERATYDVTEHVTDLGATQTAFDNVRDNTDMGINLFEFDRQFGDVNYPVNIPSMGPVMTAEQRAERDRSHPPRTILAYNSQ